MQNATVEAIVTTLYNLAKENELEHKTLRSEREAVEAAYRVGRHEAFKKAARLVDTMLQNEVAQDARDHGQEP